MVSTLALFYLHSDSELLYVGDAGTSEAGPGTARYGIEWSTYWHPSDWLTLDNELTLSEGKLLDVGSDDEIPGAVPITLNTGITLGKEEGFFGSLRSRYFSPRPLIENLTRCVIEILAGARELEQVSRWVTDDVYRNLLRRVVISTRARQAKGQSVARPTFSIGSLTVCEPRDGVVEAVVIVRGRARVRAVALRLEGLDRRWRATAINVL